MFLLLLFWGIATFTFLTQMYHLPPEPLDLIEKISAEMFKPDPYTFHPLEYNPYNDRMTLIEGIAIWMGFFYGMLRMYNIMRITIEDEEEGRWTYFWSRLEGSDSN